MTPHPVKRICAIENSTKYARHKITFCSFRSTPCQPNHCTMPPNQQARIAHVDFHYQVLEVPLDYEASDLIPAHVAGKQQVGLEGVRERGAELTESDSYWDWSQSYKKAADDSASYWEWPVQTPSRKVQRNASDDVVAVAIKGSRKSDTLSESLPPVTVPGEGHLDSLSYWDMSDRRAAASDYYWAESKQ
jgi:hypothetical protein